MGRRKETEQSIKEEKTKEKKSANCCWSFWEKNLCQDGGCVFENKGFGNSCSGRDAPKIEANNIILTSTCPLNSNIGYEMPHLCERIKIEWKQSVLS